MASLATSHSSSYHARLYFVSGAALAIAPVVVPTNPNGLHWAAETPMEVRIRGGGGATTVKDRRWTTAQSVADALF